MILTLNILLAAIVVIGIVGLLAYNIHPLRRPLRLDEVAPTNSSRPATFTSPYARLDARRAHAARRSGARSLDTIGA